MLCDVNMPGESGIELVRHVRPRMPETSVVMVTSVDNSAVAVEALEQGAYGYVLKPFARGELLIQVENAMRRRTLELFHRRTQEALRERVRVQTAKVLESREELALRLASACAARTDETRDPWHEDEGTAYMRERRGTWFDPELLDLFLENIALMRAIRLGNPD